MPEEFLKWKTYLARPVEIEAHQAKERILIQQAASERTTGVVYAQVGAWIIRAQEGEPYHTIMSSEEFKRLYQPGKKGEGVQKVPPKKDEEEPAPKEVGAVDPSAMEKGA